MSNDSNSDAAKAQVRERERAIWTDVEKVGRDVRAAETAKTVVSQVDSDRARDRPRQGQGI